jgi:hypothetical protein
VRFTRGVAPANRPESELAKISPSLGGQILEIEVVTAETLEFHELTQGFEPRPPIRIGDTVQIRTRYSLEEKRRIVEELQSQKRKSPR